MPDSDVWPPKPDLPDPLTEHDALIEASLPTLSAMTLNYDLVLPLSGVPFSNSAWVLHWTLRIKNSLLPMSEGLERRLRLTQVLLKERGLDLMQADAVVQDYYQRHGMAEIPKGAGKTLALSLVMIALAFVAMLSGAFDFFLSFHRDVILSQPNHGAAIIALDNARWLLRTVSLTLLGLMYSFWLLRYLALRVRHNRAGAVESPGRKRPSG